MCAACGRALVAETGVLTSPDYPDNYPHNRNCTWTITVPAGHQISINFTTFSLESHARCQYDYLEIRSGTTSFREPQQYGCLVLFWIVTTDKTSQCSLLCGIGWAKLLTTVLLQQFAMEKLALM